MNPEPYVAIRSYKRAGQVSTFKVYPDATVWVPESQGDAYMEAYGENRVAVIPDSEDGNPARKNNAILDRAPSEWIMILDDDLRQLGYYEGGTHHIATPAEIKHLIRSQFEIAADLGVELWGINYMKDPLAYRALCPFSLLAPIAGPFHGHLHPSLRYDEASLGKDDYDFWLQNIRKFHRTWRYNKWHYTSDHGKNPGGSVSLRTEQYEKDGIAFMLHKWGREVYRSGGQPGGKRATGKNILWSVVHVPINGT